MYREKPIKYCERTVIVLDHSPEFCKSSGTKVDFDGSSKHKASQSSSSAGVLTKTLWTTIVEGAVEYCRIINDVLPECCMVQVMASDSEPHFLNNFIEEEQNIQLVLKALAQLGEPQSLEDDDGSASIFPGIAAATQSLTESLLSLHFDTEDSSCQGRIICLTSFKSEKDSKPLAEMISQMQEKLDIKRFVHIELVIINVAAGTEKISHGKKQITPVLSSTTVTYKSSQLANRLSLLVRKHFGMSSTTVTGIPMKEEQHAGSSANYDVEIIHPAEVHHETNWLTSNSEGDSIVQQSSSINKKDSMHKDTVMLKWCTPKNNASYDLHQCVGSYRISPTEVNSRPTACLISFLQQGRIVLLEQPRKSGTKVISHMLASHGGDVYIHVLSPGRSPMEEPPSISEGSGGRVTDYRIGDFGRFMKDNRLAPMSVLPSTFEDEMPNEKAFSCLERSTRHWPMVISETYVHNMSSHLEPLLSHLIKAKLTDEEVKDCQKVIFKLQLMEGKNETLPLPMISMRGKGSKREEQYRQLWSELGTFIDKASTTSSMHKKVLECLLDTPQGSHVTSNTTSSTTTVATTKDIKTEKPPVEEMAWKELDRYTQMTDKEKKTLNQAPSDPRKRRNMDIPEESPKKKPTVSSSSGLFSSGFGSMGAKTSLISLWTNRMQANASIYHEDFEGMKQSVDGKMELYQEINKELNANLNTGTVKEWV